MEKYYSRNACTHEGWMALIDQATAWRCKVKYGPYGDSVWIDTGNLERKLEGNDEFWGDQFHAVLEIVAERGRALGKE